MLVNELIFLLRQMDDNARVVIIVEDMESDNRLYPDDDVVADDVGVKVCLVTGDVILFGDFSE